MIKIMISTATCNELNFLLTLVQDIAEIIFQGRVHSTQIHPLAKRHFLPSGVFDKPQFQVR